MRRDGSSNPKPPAYLSRHAKYTPASLAKEARETVKSVKALIEEERKYSCFFAKYLKGESLGRQTGLRRVMCNPKS